MGGIIVWIFIIAMAIILAPVLLGFIVFVAQAIGFILLMALAIFVG